MRNAPTLSKLNLFIAAAAVLLVVGLAIEGLMTKPHLREIETLQAERSRLRAEIERQRGIAAESRTVAGLLGVDSFDQLSAPNRDDPIAYISRLLDDSGLMRLGLTTSGREEAGSLQTTSYTLRAKGDFRQLQNFVWRVENGERLVSVDAFRIAPTIDAQALEGRFNLSIYDVKEEG